MRLKALYRSFPDGTFDILQWLELASLGVCAPLLCWPCVQPYRSFFSTISTYSSSFSNFSPLPSITRILLAQAYLYPSDILSIYSPCLPTFLFSLRLLGSFQGGIGSLLFLSDHITMICRAPPKSWAPNGVRFVDESYRKLSSTPL
jgi:hypothetical protein